MLFIAIIKYLSILHLDYWPYSVKYTVDILNNISKDSSFTLKEIFTKVSSNHLFRHYYTFGSLVCVLYSTLRHSMKIIN